MTIFWEIVEVLTKKQFILFLSISQMGNGQLAYTLLMIKYDFLFLRFLYKRKQAKASTKQFYLSIAPRVMALFLNSTRCPKNNNMFESSLKQYFLCMRRQFLYFSRLGCRCIVLYIFFASKELKYYSFLKIVSRLPWVIITINI